MPEAQLKAFKEAVKADSQLQEKLKAAGDADAVAEIANSMGFEISGDEIRRAAEAQFGISESELESIAGGGTQFLCGTNCAVTY